MQQFRQVTAKAPVPIEPSFFDLKDCTEVAWLAGAGFAVNCRGTVIFIDPLMMTKPEDPSVSEAGLKLKIPYPLTAGEVPRVDYVLYTHGDIDHLGPLTAKALANHHPTFVGPPPVFVKLTQLGIDPNHITVCRTGDPVQCLDVTLEITPADHPWQLQDPVRCGKPYRAGDCCGFILNTPDGRLFFPGDTRLMEDHLRIRDIQLLALDVSTCEYHLNHTSAAVLANHLSDACVLPLHFGTYDCPEKGAHCGDPEDVFAKITNGEIRGLRVAPGEVVRLGLGIVSVGGKASDGFK
jgi:L-ascorbate metabolism protein UlaG (beta-lactamase superfamily)